MDNLSKYGQSFQNKVVSSLLTDPKFLEQLSDIVSSDFFESEANKWIVSEILDYHEVYNRPPTMDVFKVSISKIDDNNEQKKSIVEQLRHIYTESVVDLKDVEFIKDEFTSFCKNQNLKNVILKSVDLLKAGSYSQIKDLVDKAMTVGDPISMGTDYIKDFDLRYEEDDRDTIPTPWNPINDLMDGGIGPGELGVVVAPSGVGKTWVLSAIGAHAFKLGKNVVYYTMDLQETYMGHRLDTVLTGIPTTEHKEKKDEIKKKILSIESASNGSIRKIYVPPRGITTKTIEQHIRRLTVLDKKPQLIIVDYADLLVSHSNKMDSTYNEQGGVYIDLRGLGGQYSVPIWTASQTNRDGIDAEIIEANKIADSYAKVMHADFIMSWSRKAQDKLNDTARVHIMKNRFGMDGMTFPSRMETIHGVIDVFEPNSADGIIASKEAQSNEKIERKILLKKYKDNLG